MGHYNWYGGDGRAKRQGHLDQGSWGGSNRGGNLRARIMNPKHRDGRNGGRGLEGKVKGREELPIDALDHPP